MKFGAKCDGKDRKWFAWRPVVTQNHKQVVWLEFVVRNDFHNGIERIIYYYNIDKTDTIKTKEMGES